MNHHADTRLNVVKDHRFKFHRDVVDISSTVSDIYRNMLRSGEGADGQNWPVSVTDVPLAAKAPTCN